MENTSKALETERQLLKLTQNKTKAILDKGNLDKFILIAATTLQGKLLYREACEQKCKWDD